MKKLLILLVLLSPSFTMAEKKLQNCVVKTIEVLEDCRVRVTFENGEVVWIEENQQITCIPWSVDWGWK